MSGPVGDAARAASVTGADEAAAAAAAELANAAGDAAAAVAQVPVAGVDPKALVAELMPMFADMVGSAVRQTLQGVGAGPKAPAAPVIEDVSDEQIEEAVRRGEPIARLIGMRASAIAKREIAGLRGEFEQLRTTGLASIQSLTESVLPAGLPYWKDYEKEIKAELASWPEHLRADPRATKEAYTLIVGRHTPEIVARETEAAIRKARDTPPAATTTGAGRVTLGDGRRPEDILPESALQQAREMGGLDKVAHMQGYSTVEAWLDDWSKYSTSRGTA